MCKMSYGPYSGVFQSIPDFSHQALPLQSSHDRCKDKDNPNMPNTVSVSNIQGVQDGMPELMHSISTTRVQSVNSANYIISSPVMNQSQQSFSTANQFAPLHYISTPTSINSNEIQIAWNDTNRSNNLLNDHLKNSVSVPIFSTLPHNSLHMNSQTVWSLKSVAVDTVGTMTDPILGSDLLELKPKRKIDFDNIDCSKVNISMQSSALSQYLARMPPQILPLTLQNFLKKHNIPYNIKLLGNNLLSKEVSAIGMGSVNVTICKDKRIHSPVSRAKTSLTTASDGSILFGCGVCDLKFSSDTHLQNHVLTTDHETERKFRCEECGLCLKRKEHLEQHRKGHSQDRPFVCSICWKGFKRSEHLKRHYGTHSDLKCFGCRVCGKAFYRKDHLAKHEQTHVSRKLLENYETMLESPSTTASGHASPALNNNENIDPPYSNDNKQAYQT